MGDAWGSRAEQAASVFAERVRAGCASGEPADGQPVASDSSTHAKYFARERVLLQESMCIAGEARTRAAWVTSVLCTRLLVCKAQGSAGGVAVARRSRPGMLFRFGSEHWNTGKPEYLNRKSHVIGVPRLWSQRVFGVLEPEG